jgi:hypothetical protein
MGLPLVRFAGFTSLRPACQLYCEFHPRACMQGVMMRARRRSTSTKIKASEATLQRRLADIQRAMEIPAI